MKKLKYILFFSIILIFILIPLPAADMTIRLHLSEIVGNNYELYYSDSKDLFNADQYITGNLDHKKNEISFRIAGSHEGIAGLRMDFPNTDTPICIEKITVSSAGIIQDQFNPSLFFSPENLNFTNDIEAISLATAQDKAYLSTNGHDPYIVLSDKVVKDIDASFSHFRLSRLFICLFVAACIFFAKKNYFASK